MAELPENPGSQYSPTPPSGGATPPPFQPVAQTYQPVAAPYQGTAAPPQAVAPPAKTGGSNVVKIVLIIVAVFVVLVIMVVGVIGYGVWRVSRAVHVNNSTGAIAINTPGGAFSANSADKFTADELGTDIYPGAQPAKGGVRMTLPTGTMVAANYLTSDSKEQVVAFYKDKFGSQASSFDTGDGAIVSINKNKQDSIMVTITQKAGQFDGKTQIHIMHTTDTKAQ